MSTTATPSAIADPESGATARRRVTPTRVFNSEWIKFRTLRSTWATLLAAVVAMVGFGVAIGFVVSATDVADLDAEDALASAPLQGYILGQLLVGVLGVLVVTGEYATGMIRATFAAVPRRLPVLGAKAAVIGGVMLVVMTLASFAAFFGAQVPLSAEGRDASLSDPGALRAVIGAGVYMTLVGLLGVALGWIIRTTAGAISALVALLLILPALVGFLPGSLGTSVAQVLPSNAGGSFMSSAQLPDTLAPWTGLGVLVLWVAAALVAAVVVVRRRDA